MRSIIATVAVSALYAAAASAQTNYPTTGPGVQAARDTHEPEVLASCKHPPPTPEVRPRPPAPAAVVDTSIKAIDGVVAANAQWNVIFKSDGNNVDGLIPSDDGGVLIAENDNSDVIKVGADGTSSIVYKDTNTGGALSRNKHGALFIVERALRASIWQLEPKKQLLTDKYEGDSLDCIGGVLNDLAAASNGGVYFSMGGLYYADPHGKVTKYGEDLRTNGIILSPDEKTLYVTNAGTLVAFDVQRDGSLKNQRVLATLPNGGGDGSTVDSAGRIYVSAIGGVVVVSPSGMVLGVIPTPAPVISLTFSGPQKKTLFAAFRSTTGPTDHGKGQIATLPMIAQGYHDRGK